MTPEEALRNILKLVEGSDELEDAHTLQILLRSIKTLAEKGLGARIDAPRFRACSIGFRAMRLRVARASGEAASSEQSPGLRELASLEKAFLRHRPELTCGPSRSSAA
jgi:hypothetical protein